MLNEYEISERILTRFKGLNPEIPEEIQTIYQSAADYFGEENVDLQHMFDKVYFRWHSLNVSLRELLESLRFSDTDRFTRHFDLNGSVMQELCVGTKLQFFLDALTEENIKHSYKVPVYSILVRFRDFDVKNEREESTPVEEMFTVSHLNYNGTLNDRMQWSRTKASRLHYGAGYRHSHLNSSSESYTEYPAFTKPCLGNGPIVMTTSALKSENRGCLWALYWCEMDQCIRVESLEGGPYIRMADIKSRRLVEATLPLTAVPGSEWLASLPPLRQVVRAVLNTGKLQWVWNENTFGIANTKTEFCILASNCVIDILTSRCSSKEEALEILSDKIRRGSMIYASFTDDDKINRLRSSAVAPQSNTVEEHPLDWSFKGEPMKFQITPGGATRDEVYYLVSPKSLSYLYNCLILTANEAYGRKNRIQDN